MIVRGKIVGRIGVFLPFCLAGMLCTAAASAQHVLPDTPRELEGFRLDSPAPAPSSAPTRSVAEPQPAEESPPTRPTVSPQPSRSGPSRATVPAPRPEPTANAAAERSIDVEAQTKVIAADAPSSASSPQQVPDVEAPDSAMADPANSADTAVAPANDEASGSQLWMILAGLAALLAVGLFLYWRRSKRKPAFEPKAEIQIEDEPHVHVAEPNALSEYPLAASQPKPPARPALEMRFDPERAVLGMVNLTIKGELKIVNHGKAVACNLRLRTAAICVNADQMAIIASFNRGVFGPKADSIDNIEKGERISIAIEISLPRSELDSYAVDGREICVPIILADLAYSGMEAGSDERIQIAAMIGREAKPPTSKMGPLRIDLGPRSFDMLGQRPVAA